MSRAQVSGTDEMVWDTRFSAPTNADIKTLAAADPGVLYAILQESAGPDLGTRTVARWTGNGWENIGGGIDGRPFSITLGPDGLPYVIGKFLNVEDSVIVDRGVGEWLAIKHDGIRWQEIGRFSAPLSSVDVSDSGVVCVGGAGDYTEPVGIQCRTNSEWISYTQDSESGSDLEFGSGDTLFATIWRGGVRQFTVWHGERLIGTDEPALKLLYTSDGRLFGIRNGAIVERKNGVWESLPPPPSGVFGRIHADPDGNLFAVARDDLGHDSVYRFENGAWRLVSSDITGSIFSIAHDGNHLFVSGRVRSKLDLLLNGFLWWNGTSWNGIRGGLGVSGDVLDMEYSADDGVYAAGFKGMFGRARGLVAKWKNGSWSALGGLEGQFVRDLAVADDGKVYVAGAVSRAGGVAAAGVAVWDGLDWSPMGAGLGGYVHTIEISPSGVVYAGGESMTSGSRKIEGVAKWEGGRWVPVGEGINLAGTAHGVHDIEFAPGGNMYLAGRFVGAGGEKSENIILWDGEKWLPLGRGLGGSMVIDIELDGTRLYAGGAFEESGSGPVRNVAYWEGGRWHAMPGGLEEYAASVTVAPDGTILVSGPFTTAGTANVNGLARWTNDQWSSVYHSTAPTGVINDVVVMDDGSVYLGGTFTTAGGIRSHKFARFGPPIGHNPDETPSNGVWPNPADSEARVSVSLETKESVSAELFDVLGRRVWTLDVRDETFGRYIIRIPTSSLAAGMYILHVHAGDESVTRRIVVQH